MQGKQEQNRKGTKIKYPNSLISCFGKRPQNATERGRATHRKKKLPPIITPAERQPAEQERWLARVFGARALVQGAVGWLVGG